MKQECYINIFYKNDTRIDDDKSVYNYLGKKLCKYFNGL